MHFNEYVIIMIEYVLTVFSSLHGSGRRSVYKRLFYFLLTGIIHAHCLLSLRFTASFIIIIFILRPRDKISQKCNAMQVILPADLLTYCLLLTYDYDYSYGYDDDE